MQAQALPLVFPPPNLPRPDFPFVGLARAGEGSMGSVWRAVEPGLGRQVAIKVPNIAWLASLDGPDREEMCARFLQEARAAAAITHPGAVVIHRVGQVDGVPFIAMEWLDGEPLSHLLQRHGSLTVARSVDIAWQVLETLAAVHRGGVLHRDIKPANVMLLPDGRIKLVDFGVAKWQKGGLVQTQAGVFLGSPAYAAPEQFRGAELDPRSDLYSVAVMLYEMLTGQLPYPGPTLTQLMQQLLLGPPPNPCQLRSEVPQPLGAVVLKGLAQNPAERFPNAESFASALAPFRALGGEIQVFEEDPFPPALVDAAPTVRVGERSTYPLVQTPGGTLCDALTAHVTQSWRLVELPEQNTYQALAKLCETPVHTEAFAGVVQLRETLLLLCNGEFLAALRASPKGVKQLQDPQLPERCAMRLYLPPAGGSQLVELLAAVASGAWEPLQRVDGSLVKGEELAARLASQAFSGVVRVELQGNVLAVIFLGGEPKLALAAGQWPSIQGQESWYRWLKSGATLEVLRPAGARMPLTYRVRNRDLLLQCQWEQASSGLRSTVTKRLGALAGRASGPRVATIVPQERGAGYDLDHDPAFVLLRWLLQEGLAAAQNPNLASRWKYLLTWVPLVAQARLYHQLPRPEGGGGEEFDLVTQDRHGKVLHLGVVLPSQPPVGAFASVLHRAISAKLARVATGDVGALILAAPSFSPEFLADYLATLESRAKGLARLQEALSGYAGFVRLRHDRGFHVLLLQQGAEESTPMWE